MYTIKSIYKDAFLIAILTNSQNGYFYLVKRPTTKLLQTLLIIFSFFSFSSQKTVSFMLQLHYRSTITQQKISDYQKKSTIIKLVVW